MPPGRTSNGGGCFLPIKFTEGEIFTPSEYIEEGVVPMIFQKHLCVTYDNYRRYISGHSCNSDNCFSCKRQISEKDNRPVFQT